MSVLDPSAIRDGVPTSQSANRNPTVRRAGDTRWVTALQSVRDRILQDPRYAPEVLIQRHRARLKRIRRRQRIVVACGILCVLASATWLGLNHSRLQAHPWATYQREADQIEPVLLRDGSVFQLNDRSRVRVNLTDSTRYVWVDSGEVFFDVSPDAQRPFDVQVGTTRLIAKGTAFSVRKDDTGEVETTVRHGLVEVQVPRLYRGAPEQTRDTRKAAATRAVGEIKAGEVGTIDADGQFSVTQVEEADIARRLAWADPVRSLNGMTLNQAVALFNRYNARKLEIADLELGRMPVSGLYHLTQPEQFIERLGQLGIRHVIQGSEAGAGARIILMRK